MEWIVTLYFFLLPFQFALSPVTGIDLAIIRIVSIAVVFVWCARGLLMKKLILPPLLPSFFLLSFLFLAGSSFVWAIESSFALRKALFLLSFLPLFFVFAAWFEEEQMIRVRFLRAYVLGAFGAAISSLILFFLQFVVGVEVLFSFITQKVLPFFLGATFGESVASYPSLLVNISGKTVLRASGVFPDPHMFSFYVGMAIPVAMALAFTDQSKKSFWLMVGIVLFIADLLTFSRGGYVGLVCAGVIFLVGTIGIFRFSFRQSVLAVVFLILLSGVLLISPIGTRLFSSFSLEDGSNVERLRLWQEASGHILERPFLGVGLGNYSLLVKPNAFYREPIYAHNLFFDITLELGMVGFFLFFSLVGCALMYAFLAWQKTRERIPFSIALSLVLFLGHSFFETPLFSVHVLPVLLLFLAIGVSYKYDSFSSQ